MAADAPSRDGARCRGWFVKWIRGDKAANYNRVEPPDPQKPQPRGAKIVCTTECFLDGFMRFADKSIPLETYRDLGEPIPEGVYFQKAGRLGEGAEKSI